MGSQDHYPEERPQTKHTLEGFFLDSRPVTNAEFKEFVKATEYITLAELPPDSKDYPELDPHKLQPGSAVFVQPQEKIDLSNPLNWWTFILGANWKHPAGPGSNIDSTPNHPVVHIAYVDALAYAKWAEKDLPTEKEWEYAARGGLLGAEYSWGNQLKPNDKAMANIWEGEFPYFNSKDTEPGTTSVGSYPPNDYGLYDMCGNVWEWSKDEFKNLYESPSPGCCPPTQNIDSHSQESQHTRQQNSRYKRRVLKGGSYLCSQNYCSRYRPAARIPETEDTSTNHLGFRCIRRP